MDGLCRDQVVGIVHSLAVPSHKRRAVQSDLADVHVIAIDAHQVARIVRVLQLKESKRGEELEREEKKRKPSFCRGLGRRGWGIDLCSSLP